MKPLNLHPHEVRAALASTLGMIVRPVKPQPQEYAGGCYPPDRKPKHPAPYIDAYCGEKKTPANPRGMGRVWCWWTEDDRMGPVIGRCPLGQPGDELWGRETWAYFGGDEYLYQQIRDNVAYRSDDLGFDDPVGGRWRPSIQMPRWASRFAFTIKAVRFERVQDISEADAIAEGVEPNWIGDLNPPGGMAWDAKEHGWNPYDGDESQEGFPAVTAKDSFQGLFDMLNGPGSWDSNPWVWVYHVERIGE